MTDLKVGQQVVVLDDGGVYSEMQDFAKRLNLESFKYGAYPTSGEVGVVESLEVHPGATEEEMKMLELLDTLGSAVGLEPHGIPDPKGNPLAVVRINDVQYIIDAGDLAPVI